MTDLTETIHTARLLLRPIRPGDGLAVHEAKLESWDEFSRWWVWTPQPREQTTVEGDEEFCCNKSERHQQRSSFCYLAFSAENGKLIGQGSLNHCNWDDLRFTLAYWVRTSETGKGYASEIASALCNYAFDKLSARRIIGYHAEGNTGSQRVLLKCGFTHEGTFRQHHHLAQGYVDEFCYGLLASDQRFK